MSKYRVTAMRWGRGWELHVDGIGVTQCRTLATAEQQVRDFVATELNRDVDPADSVHLSIEVGDGLEDEVARAREMTAQAAHAQQTAAAEARRVARRLRSSGLSVADTAAVMAISKGRVSQLVG
ncbi:MAG: antitoxin HicB [Mycobacteriaceae bacterium]